MRKLICAAVAAAALLGVSWDDAAAGVGRGPTDLCENIEGLQKNRDLTLLGLISVTEVIVIGDRVTEYRYCVPDPNATP